MRALRLSLALLSCVLLAAGCAAKYVPTERMRKLAASMDPADAANLFTDSLGRSLRGAGLCKAPFGFDDPKATTSMDAFTVQAWRAGEEIGRRQENGRTVISYAKVRYAEVHRYADLSKIRVVSDARGMCAGPVAPGQVAISLYGRGLATPLVVAVAVGSMDELLAALTILAPKAALIEGAGL